eukprot:Rhum_TRINITY_DN13200_c0_g1::Rhum_TRINITY_DN13200_c0_g1_i1::g.57952::m.57952
MLLQQLASLSPGAVACVAAVVVREVASVSLVRADGKRVEAVEFEVCDATARLRAVATDAGHVSALRAAVGSQCVLLHASLRPVGDPLCLRLVLRPSCAVVPVEAPLTAGEEDDLEDRCCLGTGELKRMLVEARKALSALNVEDVKVDRGGEC